MFLLIASKVSIKMIHLRIPAYEMTQLENAGEFRDRACREEAFVDCAFSSAGIPSLNVIAAGGFALPHHRNRPVLSQRATRC